MYKLGEDGRSAALVHATPVEGIPGALAAFKVVQATLVLLTVHWAWCGLLVYQPQLWVRCAAAAGMRWPAPEAS